MPPDKMSTESILHRANCHAALILRDRNRLSICATVGVATGTFYFIHSFRMSPFLARRDNWSVEGTTESAVSASASKTRWSRFAAKNSTSGRERQQKAAGRISCRNTADGRAPRRGTFGEWGDYVAPNLLTLSGIEVTGAKKDPLAPGIGG